MRMTSHLTPRVGDPLEARTGVAQSSVERLLLFVAESFVWTRHVPQLNAFTARRGTLNSKQTNKRPAAAAAAVVVLTSLVRFRTLQTAATNIINPLITTLKPQSNGPSYSNTVIGTLAVDGWAVTFATARRGLGGAAARPRCTKCNSPPSTASVPTLYYLM